MPGDLPAWMWLLAFLVLQFSYSCFPPPRPRPPTFVSPTPSSTTSASSPTETTTGPGAATAPTTATSPATTTAPTTATSPGTSTPPEVATPPNTATSPGTTTPPDTTTSPPVTTTASSGTGTCNTTVFSESSMLPHWPASNVLIESQDAQDDKGRFNYWLGNENGMLILDLGCDSLVDKIDLINTKNAWAKDRATKRFRLLGSMTSTGPYDEILEESLPDSRQQEVVPTISFTFQATTVRYIQFMIVDIWGRGGGLQYLGLVTGSQGAITTPSPTEGITTTSPLPWESGSTSVDIEDGQTYACQIHFEFALHKGVKVKNAQASCSEGTSSPNALHIAGKHFFEVTSTSGLILECSLKVVLVKTSLPSNVLDDTLVCTPKDNDCFTTSGDIFPAPCVFPFIHNKRRYKACTDVGSKDPDKIWCATATDSQGEAVPGQEGFCSKNCGYCAGTDVTSRADEPRPCGYDCLVSADWYSFPILKPVITLEEPIKENYLKNSAGQHSLNMGDQIIKVTCPDTKFYADALKSHKEVYAKCGPTQYRFTISSVCGITLDNAFHNHNFGCDACPTGFRLTFGYFNFGDFKSSGVFFNIASTSACSRICEDSSRCESFLFRKSTGWCELIQEKIEKATIETQYSDYIICAVEGSMLRAESEETCSSGCTDNHQCTDPNASMCDKETGNCEICTRDEHCKHIDNKKACADGRGCRKCTDNHHCTDPNASMCVKTTGQCEMCTGEEHCGHIVNKPVCDPDRGCRQCTTEYDKECKKTPATPYCSEKSYSCVTCLASKTHCTTPAKPFCNAKGKCVIASDCKKMIDSDACDKRFPRQPNCHSDKRECVECEKQEHCKLDNNAGACKPDTYTCVECIKKNDCKAYKGENFEAAKTNAYGCDTNNKCVQCTGKDDCKAYKGANDESATTIGAYECNTNNKCVQCIKDDHCNNHHMNWKTCNVNQMCETQLICVGFTYPAGKTPELKIMNTKREEKISFHFPATAEPSTPSTVNCPYKKTKGTTLWDKVDFRDKNYYLGIVNFCKAQVKNSGWKWEWDKDEVVNNRNNFFSIKQKETAPIASNTFIPKCFHKDVPLT